jgi:class 3 adenylate cyclase
MSKSESDGLPILIQQLERLLLDANLLRCDAIYGKPWCDAENESRAWLHDDDRSAKAALRGSGLAMSGRYLKGRIEAQFECAKRSLAGFFEARRLIIKRRHELCSMLNESQSTSERCEWIKGEIARLQSAQANPSEDPEYGRALQVVRNAFDGVMNSAKTLAEARSRGIREGGAHDAKAILAVADQTIDAYRGPATAHLVREISERLEQARIELHKAGIVSSGAGDDQASSIYDKDWARKRFARIRDEFAELRRTPLFAQLIHMGTNAEAEGVVGTPMPPNGMTLVLFNTGGIRNATGAMQHIGLYSQSPRTSEAVATATADQRVFKLVERAGKLAETANIEIFRRLLSEGWRFQSGIDVWCALIFEFARVGGHPLLKTKRQIWTAPNKRIPYEITEVKALASSKLGSIAEIPERWSNRLPDAYVSEIEDVVWASQELADAIIAELERAARSAAQKPAKVGAADEEERSSLIDWVGAPRANLTVVFSDIKDYSKLVGDFGDIPTDGIRNEHLKKAGQYVVKFGGRRVKHLEDGLLSVFKSCTSALDYARALAIDTGHERVRIRIGICVGEVGVQDEDIHGQFVNTAQRLENEASPNGICVSDEVHKNITQSRKPEHSTLLWKSRDVELKNVGLHKIWETQLIA